MELLSQRHKAGKKVDYTNSSGVLIPAGTFIAVGGRVGQCPCDLYDGESVALDTEGFYCVRKTGVAMPTPGTQVSWDNDGNPVNETAGTGAAAAAGDLLLGSLVYPAADTDEYCVVAINVFTNADVLATA